MSVETLTRLADWVKHLRLVLPKGPEPRSDLDDHTFNECRVDASKALG